MTNLESTALARGTLLNLLGLGLPLAVALLCLPVVTAGLPPDSFGLLVLSWAVLGYVSTFDLGFGRAAAHHIAAALARDQGRDAVPRFLGTSLVAQTALGCTAAFVIWAAAPTLATRVFDLPPDLRADGQASLRLIGLAAPAVLLSSSLRGALFAAQQYVRVNAVIVPASSSLYALSALGVVAGWTLPTIVAVLAGSRLIVLAALWKIARRHCPGLAGRRLSIDRGTFRTLLRFGSWVTVSGLVRPLLASGERVFVPALLSVRALAFYAVPFEAISRLAIVPASMALALFPAFSRLERHEGETQRQLVIRPMKYLVLMMTPLLAFGALFADDLLTAWVGPRFAVEAAPAARVLALAFYLSAFSHILRAALHGLGRPDLKAKVDVANAGLFVVLLFVMTPRFGLIGAAGARLVSTLADLLVSFALLAAASPGELGPRRLFRQLRPHLAAAGVFAIAAAWLSGTSLGYLSFGAALAVYLLVFWTSLADAADRRLLTRIAGWLRHPGRGGLLSTADAGDGP